jgi:LCP family protein required for cell wall assembly
MDRTTRQKVRKRTRNRRILKGILIAVLLGGLVAGVILRKPIRNWAAAHYWRIIAQEMIISQEEQPNVYEELAKWHDPSKLLNILCVGIDKGSVKGESGYCRSDVMLVVSIDVVNKRVAAISIPRDTQVQIPGHGTQKINAAHAFDGPEGAIRVVKSFTGLEIHHYVEVDFEAFKRVVDAIGGVPFYLEKTINDPKAGGVLVAGDYNLTGDQALIIVRSRNDPEADLYRIRNQQKFLYALAQKAITIRNIQQLRQILDAAVSYVKTTMNPDMMIDLAKCMQGISIDRIQMATVPGTDKYTNGVWYYVHDPVKTTQLFDNVQKYCMVEPPQDEVVAEILNDPSKLSLMVLNGSGKAGMASQAAETLKGIGYLPRIGDAKHRYDRTTIYISPGYWDVALKLVSDLRGDWNPVMEFDDDVCKDYQSKVVVVLGKDY